MSTYYIKGGSKFNEANPNVWVALHLAGYPSGHYLDTGWKDLNVSGASEDPYWRLGGDGGLKEVEFGLSGNERIKINTAGIWGWHVESGAWFSLYGSGAGEGVTDHGELDGLGDDDHSQYLNIARGDARYYKTELIFHTGELYHTGQLFTSTYIIAQYTSGSIFVDLSGDYLITSGDYVTISGAYNSHQDEANAHHRPTAINDTPTDAETTTGVSSNWAYDHLQEYETTSGAIADYGTVSGDYVDTSGMVNDYPTVSGDWAETSGIIADYPTVSGDFAEVSGVIDDYAVVSGAYSTHQDNSTAHHTPPGAGDLLHNELGGLNVGVEYEHISQDQKDALHAIYTDNEVRTIIDEEIAEGQSIDNAIDALIADFLIAAEIIDVVEASALILTAGTLHMTPPNGDEAALTITSSENAVLQLQGDRNNDDETKHAWMSFWQDGVSRFLHIGVGKEDDDNEGFITVYEKLLINIGALGSGTKKLEINASGIEVVGNIIVSGTVDGADVSDLKTAFDALDYLTEAEVNALIPSAGDFDHDDIANPQGNANEQHLTAAEVAQLHDDEITTNAHADARIAAADHDVLQNPNGNAEEQHLTAAQVGDLHEIYTLEVHDNDEHDPDYAAETRVFEQSAAFPEGAVKGDLHYDEDLDSWYRYNGEAEAWVEVGVGGLVAGSVDNLGNHTATQNLAMAGFDITSNGALDIKSTGIIKMQPGGDNDDYWQFTTGAHLAYLQAIGCTGYIYASQNLLARPVSRAYSYEDIALVEMGTYTGDGSTGKFITVGFRPQYVCIYENKSADDATISGFNWIAVSTGDRAHEILGDNLMDHTIRSETTNGFYVDDDALNTAPNEDGIGYVWVAIG